MFLQACENVMIDLETLATSTDCVILSIGACGYTSGGELKEFYECVSIDDQLELGRSVESDTVMWWFGQGDEARKAIVEGQKYASRLNVVITDFTIWLQVNFHDGLTVWSNGASFDIPILANAYKSLGYKLPWNFWQERCFRTVKSIYRHVKSPVQQTAHNALLDAKNQLQHLNLIIKAMAEGA